MPIQDLARTDVVTATEDASIAELAQLNRDEDVGSVVITNGDTPIGIVTDRNLTTRVLAEERDRPECQIIILFELRDERHRCRSS